MSNTRNGGRKSALASFMKQNKSLMFMLPVLAVLVIVLVIIYWPKKPPSSTGDPSAIPATPSISASSEASESTPANMEGAAVVVLPQVERLQSGDTMNPDTPVKDVFSADTDSFVLKGLLISSHGNHRAIIETGTSVFVVGVDDALTDKWTVSTIESQQVVLKSEDGSEKILEAGK